MIITLFSNSVMPLQVDAHKRHLTIQPDTTTFLHNPLNGWVIYLNRNWDSDFWQKEDYEHLSVSENSADTVNITNYASTCYFRAGWRFFEPVEGQYAWLNPNSRLMRLLGSVIQHGCKIAFRIVVDGRDQGQNTPLYVKEAGAKGFTDNSGIWTPYVDDPIFQMKYEKFICALGQHFNDPDIMSFIDGYGFGKWGEGHSVAYSDYNHKKTVFKWNIDLYARVFSKVPTLINYHRLIGDTISWGEPSKDSEDMLDYAVRQGCSLRHDAFGMTDYYQDWEKQYAKKWRYIRPVIMEGGWITGAHHHYWTDSSKKYRKGYSEDVRQGEFSMSAEAHVNMMDFRVGDETYSWFKKAFPLVKRFLAQGGYRLYPSEISYDNSADHNGLLIIHHQWNNLGWGYCPTNIPQWNQRYKVAFAFINKDGQICKIFVDSQTDLSKWYYNAPVKYITALSLSGLPRGRYTLAVGLFDVRGNKIGIHMAVSQEKQHDLWLKIGEIKINK
jgi:hypothetical protein